jgi:hypothetical protein
MIHAPSLVIGREISKVPGSVGRVPFTVDRDLMTLDEGITDQAMLSGEAGIGKSRLTGSPSDPGIRACNRRPTTRMRKRRPLMNWSATKSSDQRSFGHSGTSIGAGVSQSKSLLVSCAIRTRFRVIQQPCQIYVCYVRPSFSFNHSNLDADLSI